MADPKQKPGPEADHLQIEGDWKDAVKEALGKKRPEGGWPKPGGRKTKRPKAKKPSGARS